MWNNAQKMESWRGSWKRWKMLRRFSRRNRRPILSKLFFTHFHNWPKFLKLVGRKLLLSKKSFEVTIFTKSWNWKRRWNAMRRRSRSTQMSYSTISTRLLLWPTWPSTTSPFRHFKKSQARLSSTVGLTSSESSISAERSSTMSKKCTTMLFTTFRWPINSSPRAWAQKVKKS